MARLRSSAIAIGLLFGVALFLNSTGDYAAAGTPQPPSPAETKALEAVVDAHKSDIGRLAVVGLGDWGSNWNGCP